MRQNVFFSDYNNKMTITVEERQADGLFEKEWKLSAEIDSTFDKGSIIRNLFKSILKESRSQAEVLLEDLTERVDDAKVES